MENICDDLLLHLPLLLPQDVLIQILVFLPVISLLRFKSVCKSWRALIESSFFIHLHVNTLPHHNSYSSKIGTFIFQTTYVCVGPGEHDAFMLSSRGNGGSGGVKDDDEFEELKLEDLGFPPCLKVSDEVFMVGSCNGLICLHDTKQRDVSLWNPATRQFRFLPKSLNPLPGPETGIGDLHQDFVAFGYDVKTKDYKVVQISSFRPYMSGQRWLRLAEYIFRVQVYNLSTDSWRLLEEGINSFPALPQQGIGMNHGVYLNGSYYFLAYLIETATKVDSQDMILSFDFTNEIFSTIQLPHDYHLSEILTYFGEKLAIFAEVVVKDETDFYDIWVFNEHGVKESWTKVHSIGRPYYFSGTPRGISNNGEFAFVATDDSNVINGVCVPNCKLQLFNLVTKEVKKDFRTGYCVSKADVYKQSLVSIGGNGASVDRVIGGAT